MTTRRSFSLRALAVLASFAVAGPALIPLQAAPPAPEPTPPGTVFLGRGGSGGSLYQIKADGSGMTATSLPTITRTDPSFYLYGADNARWFVTFDDVGGGRELFAYRIPAGATAPVGPRVQLTSLFPNYSVAYCQWSNGGDSFVSFFAYENSSGFAGLYRIDVSAAQLEAGGVTPVGPMDVRFSALVPSFAVYDSSPDVTRWDTSPDGGSVAWVQRHRIWVTRPDGSASPVATCQGDINTFIDWAYQGNKIGFEGLPVGRSATGIYTVDAATGTVALVKASTQKDSYTGPKWSPNGAHLVVSTRTVRQQNKTFRMKADGTGEFVIYNADPSTPVRWVSDVQQ